MYATVSEPNFLRVGVPTDCAITLVLQLVIVFYANLLPSGHPVWENCGLLRRNGHQPTVERGGWPAVPASPEKGATSPSLYFVSQASVAL